MAIRSESLVGLAVRLFPLASLTVGGISLALPLTLALAAFLKLSRPRTSVFLIGVLALLVVKYLNDMPRDTFEWSKTAVLFTVNTGVLFGLGERARQNCWPGPDRVQVTKWFNFLVWVFALHGLFLAVQYAMFNWAGNFALLNPFGGFSPIGPNPATSLASAYNPMFQPIKRPNGLAWEPSAAAFWQLSGLALLLHPQVRVHRLWAKAIMIIGGALVTNSAIGILVLVAVGAHAAYFGRRVPAAKLWLVYPLLLAFVALAGSLAIDALGPASRISEFSRVGTSGYVRWVAPIDLISERGFSLFGSEALGERGYRQYWQFTSRDSDTAGIANMVFETYIYFGAVGIALYVFLVGRLFLQSTRNPGLACLLLLMPMFGGYLFNTLALYPLFIVLAVHQMVGAQPALCKVAVGEGG